jgi:hypothetical protein
LYLKNKKKTKNHEENQMDAAQTGKAKNPLKLTPLQEEYLLKIGDYAHIAKGFTTITSGMSSH